MRKLQITLIALFLAVAIAFCAVFLHDRLTADHTAVSYTHLCNGVQSLGSPFGRAVTAGD